MADATNTGAPPSAAPKMPPLPEWGEVHDKLDEGKDLTAIEQIVFDNEPAGLEQTDCFREQLQAALQEAFDAGLAAGRAAGTVTIDAPVVTIDRPARRAPSPDFPGGF